MTSSTFLDGERRITSRQQQKNFESDKWLSRTLMTADPISTLEHQTLIVKTFCAQNQLFSTFAKATVEVLTSSFIFSSACLTPSFFRWANFVKMEIKILNYWAVFFAQSWQASNQKEFNILLFPLGSVLCKNSKLLFRKLGNAPIFMQIWWACRAFGCIL